MLEDGTIVPHFVGLEGPRTSSQFYENLDDNAFRQGQIIKVHSPSDETNRTKKFYEYDVLALDTQGATLNSKTVFYNCLMTDKFGSQADFERWQPRFSKIQEDETDITPNTRVLIKCIDGNVNKAVIVGCYKHPFLYNEGNQTKAESEQKGPYYEAEYNGINIKVNSDGELELTRRGATNNDGSAKDTSDAVGYKITLSKDGSAKFVTGDGDQIIQWDHPAKKIRINASNGVELGGGEALVLGNTYRAAEDQLLSDTYIILIQILALFQSISIAAASIPITAHIQAAIDPLLAPLVTQAAQPLPKFLGQAATYLSKTNTTK